MRKILLLDLSPGSITDHVRQPAYQIIRVREQRVHVYVCSWLVSVEAGHRTSIGIQNKSLFSQLYKKIDYLEK